MESSTKIRGHLQKLGKPSLREVPGSVEWPGETLYNTSPNMESLDTLLRSAKAWSERLRKVTVPAALEERVRLAPFLETLLNIERRINEGNRAPVRIALFGPTGAGKSKIFNSLIGENLSPSSYRRPWTHRPVYYLHKCRTDFLPSLRGEVCLHERPGWEDRILIDAPDFDSVEAENRALADQIYLEADAYIFVADVHKYADASTWSYLERIRSEGKACSFVLNKVHRQEVSKSDGPLKDFRRMLQNSFQPDPLPGPLVVIADQPQGDEELLPRDDPGLKELRDELERLYHPGTDGETSLLVDSFRIDLERLLLEWDRFSGPLREYRSGIERLSGEVDAAYERGAEELRTTLQGELDPSLKNEVYREMLRRIERIDVLRYPRKLLALPAIGLKNVFGRFWTKFRARSPTPDEEDDPREALNLAALEDKFLDLCESARKALQSEPACPGLLNEETYQSLRLEHAAVKDRYQVSSAEFRAWAAQRAKTTASTLTTEHKVKFILSQVIYNTVVIGLQVKTAGTLTLTEVFADGILSPLVAKAVGMAVSSEQVLEFEKEAREEHSRRLVEILKEGRDRFTHYLSRRARELEGVDQLAPELEDLRSSRELLVECFTRGESQ